MALEPRVTAHPGESHYGRGSVAVGCVLFAFAAIYMGQVIWVLQEVRQVVAESAQWSAPDGRMRPADLLHFRIYDFFLTREAWAASHLWLLWVR
jgi:hypothetical protein